MRASASACGPSPTAARRSSSRPGSATSCSTSPVSGVYRYWVPYCWGSPRCIRTRSVRYARLPGLASPRRTASPSSTSAWSCRSSGPCWTSSHAAWEPSSPTTDFPGQPCTVMICRIRAELAWSIAIMTAICSRVGLAGSSVRAFWSAATRASSSARSAAAALGVRLMCQVYTDLVQCPNGLPVGRPYLRLHSGGARRAVEARAPQEGLAARIRSTRAPRSRFTKS